MTTTNALTIGRVAGHIGADVSGVDLAEPLAPSIVAEIRAALLEHKVLFFRGQDRLDHAGQVAFASRFGQLIARARPQSGGALEAFPQIWTISPQADTAVYGFDHEEHYRSRQHHGIGGWHTDLSTAVNPPAASVLRAETVPSRGGDTQWTNLEAAYEGLPAQLQRFLDGLQAEHTFFAAYDMSPHDEVDRQILEQVNGKAQVAVHPVVRVHPETGRKALFVSPARVNRVLGLNPMENRHLLELLFREVTRPEYTVRFSWERGSVAFWDNRSTAHLGIGDFAHTDEPRALHRVTLLGDKPVGPDGFTSTKTVGRELTACPS
ncbi:TauD/TfdA dioxygenase family protein [Streptomyces lydicus]|uniref:TauD/TfdA dioxygenase family protein n=1 Tax=Streptomyces lydicus TaxID=47763 RepID=UPI001011DFC4|nr:TauD/TfdA family dioxygenase [Streptomyces lydicus]MCZ1012218.1 TauD/TfdA family dioxygenase [Streptomyces lydicus]